MTETAFVKVEDSNAPLVSTAVANALTVDVEDYFQVQAFANVVSPDAWENYPRRVEKNTERLLQIFADAGVKGTFFTLGWVAERHPSLIRRIAVEGHELASHGYRHIRANTQTPEQFRIDVTKAKSILEDAGGARVRGYRAATFSIGRENWWAFDILADVGYAYSSSTHPVRHDLYGSSDGSRLAFRVASNRLAEIPITTLRLLGRNLPFAGGGYFRLLPYGISGWALRHVAASERQPGVFYLHPWEIDPSQPRFDKAPLKARLRHYLNLHATEPRLKRLLADFSWTRMDLAFSHIIDVG